MMPRNMNRKEQVGRAKNLRQRALDRPEILQPTSPRAPAAGPVSMAVKVNPDAALIESVLANRRGKK